jgi:hypothetical protein
MVSLKKHQRGITVTAASELLPIAAMAVSARDQPKAAEDGWKLMTQWLGHHGRYVDYLGAYHGKMVAITSNKPIQSIDPREKSRGFARDFAMSEWPIQLMWNQSQEPLDGWIGGWASAH